MVGFIGNLLMQKVQLASIALGSVILLFFSGAGMLALGGALIVAGVARLAMRYSSTNTESESSNAIDFHAAQP